MFYICQPAYQISRGYQGAGKSNILYSEIPERLLATEVNQVIPLYYGMVYVVLRNIKDSGQLTQFMKLISFIITHQSSNSSVDSNMG